ncbi:hypothetical protein T02_9965, partial [Trichinella nativa]
LLRGGFDPLPQRTISDRRALGSMIERQAVQPWLLQENGIWFFMRFERASSIFYTITETELETFLGTLLKMGLVPKPRYSMYWSMELRCDAIVDAMSGNRFHESIDEEIIPYKGRNKLKQYIPKKPKKWGIKVNARTGMSGLLYDFCFYEGKVPRVKKPSGCLTFDIVMKLCEIIKKRHPHHRNDSAKQTEERATENGERVEKGCSVLVQDKKGCIGGVTTNLDVTAVIRRTPHGDDCPVDEHTAYRMEKRAILKKRSAEEPKTIPEVRSAMYKQRVKRFPRLPRDRQDLVLANEFTRTKCGKAFLLTQSASKHILIFSTAGSIKLLAAMKTWGMDGTFKVVPYWYEQLFTIHAFAAGKLVPAVCCLCTDKDIGTYEFISQALISRAAALEVDLNPDTIICDFETALIPAIQGGTYLEGWHNRLNKKADGNKLRLYKLFYLLKEEQGVMETLIN